jgi:hypothetical protein
MKHCTLRFVLLFAAFATGVATRAPAQQPKTRDQLVREDRENVDALEHWIYNDVAAGFEAARSAGKPLLVIFRCIPCKACAQLDQNVVEADPQLEDLLNKFVCVRVVQANGMDLKLFQFDYDQSFAAFILNGDGTIYGRYGTRSHQTESDEDVSLAGFVAALEEGLRIHAAYPGNQAELAGKQPQTAPQFSTPEQFPRLSKKYGAKLDYEGKVAASCIHCHQVGESLQAAFRDQGRPIPLEVLFPYPHPKIVGLIMDPTSRAKVARVERGSSAERAGLLAGDEILTLDGQSITSIADLQWVLHNVRDQPSLPASIRRDGRTTQATLTLAPGWRTGGDISWRATSWALRRMTTGGMRMDELTPARRAERNLDEDSMALVVSHVGEYGEHAHAKKQGFKKGDIVTAVAGESKRMRESDWFAMLIDRPVGEEVPVRLLRGSQPLELSLVMQK